MGFYFYSGGSTFDLGVPTHKSKKGVLKSRSSRGSGWSIPSDASGLAPHSATCTMNPEQWADAATCP